MTFDDERDDIPVEATGTESTTDQADEINIEVTASENAEPTSDEPVEETGQASLRFACCRCCRCAARSSFRNRWCRWPPPRRVRCG